MPAAKRLTEYVEKRDFAVTPEPRGRRAKRGARLRFVVQMHRATRLHYDFRLEADGVLASWAVPKGPTLAPNDRRLAMHVEDHPMAYRTFEGKIPAGQYGAGEVIVWDEGWYALAEGSDPADEIAKGKITFAMHGKKLKGLFTLVRIKPRTGESGEPWLLLKDHDAFEDPSWDPAEHAESVRSGKTLAEIKRDPASKTWRSKAEPLPKKPSVELATLIDAPFDDPDWLFEIKWDGYRAVCTVDARGALTLVSRNGHDLLAQFPQLADLASAFSPLPIVADGEIVALDARGRSDFQRLQEAQQRGHALTFVAFDVLYAQGRDRRSEPLEARKALLERCIADDTLVLYSKHVIGKGRALFAQARRRRLEGIIGKKRTSRYVGRRTRDWVKIKAQSEQEFVVGGWTEPRGSRKGFGSLLLGAYVEKKLRFVGSVGAGFSAKRIAEIVARLKTLARVTSPFDGPVRANAVEHWAKPELVAEVRFAEWTREGLLRQPAFLGLRTDKDARDVVLELPEHRGAP
ncbi:MAG: non-homologous end-joining DNA ligase [bacterium]|nr:non-homologous end-joining DNA ligase [bacterium]